MPGYPHFPLRRGDIYEILFKQTSDPKHSKGKPKYVLILQSGPYFAGYETVSVVLLTSKIPAQPYPTDVLIPQGTIPGLSVDTVVTCAQIFTIPKKDIEHTPFVGHLSDAHMDQVNEALTIGLQIVDILKKN